MATLMCCCRWRDDYGAYDLQWQAVPDSIKNKAGLYRLARRSDQAQRDCARAGRGQVTLQEASRESGRRVQLGHFAAILWLDDNWGECEAIFIVTLIFAICIFPRSWLDYFSRRGTQCLHTGAAELCPQRDGGSIRRRY